MLSVNKEIWLWRFVGIFSLALCTLNLSVLMHAGKSPTNPLEKNKENFIQQARRKAVREDHSTTTKNVNTRQAQHPTAKEKVLSIKDEKKPGTKEIAESVAKLPFLGVHNIKTFFKPDQVILVGKKRSIGAYLVIGVPTVKRSKAYYLLETIESLINGLSKSEQSEVVIVIFVADFDSEFRIRVKTDVLNKFPSEVESGLIQCIIAPQGYYPSMKKLPLLHGDSAQRVIWRSKQSLDYSFLYFHCADLGQYFLQLEDDVLAEDRYLPKIKGFINSRTSKWSTLEFGARGFIGMMYETKHLASLAKYCRMNYFLMPVDWLFRVFNDMWLYGNERGNVHKPPIFTHIGTYSSLDGQVRNIYDKMGNIALPKTQRVHKDANNPKAIVESSIVQYVANYSIEKAYTGGSFWGKTIIVGDYIRIAFGKTVKLQRFVVISGSVTYPTDALENSEVFVCAAPSGVCDAYKSIFKAFDKATVDTGNVSIGYPIKCIKLVINTVRKDKHGVSKWLLIREIDVWTK